MKPRHEAHLALFDLDNTLADRGAAFARWSGLFTERYGLPAGAERWIHAADRDGLVPRSAFLADARRHFAMTTSLEELLRWYDSTYPASYFREERSPTALKRLRSAGWSVAIVTNGRTAVQVEKIRRTGLSEVVDVVVVSEDVGFRKPDRRIFAAAARRSGVPLAGWMIGDSPSADVAGGADAGLRTVWLSRGREWRDDRRKPDRCAMTVTEAVAILLSQ